MSNSKQHQKQDEDLVDIKDLFFNIFQHWPIILASILFSLFLAVMYLRVTLPVYSVDAMLQVESKSAGSDLLLGDLAGFDGKSVVRTEIEIIKSRMILGEVAQKLNLDVELRPYLENKFDKWFKKAEALQVTHDEFGVVYENDKMQKVEVKRFSVNDTLLDTYFVLTFKNKNQYTLKSLDGHSIHLEGTNGKLLTSAIDDGNIQLELNYTGVPNQSFILRKRSLLSSTRNLSGKLTAFEKGKLTGILALSLQGINKEKITRTLNEVIDIYVTKNLAKKTAEKEKTLTFLEKQLPEIKNDLKVAENKFNSFRNRNDTVDVNKEAQLLLEQSVQLGKTRLELEQKKAELTARFTDEYPLLSQVNSQIKTIERKVNDVNKRLKNLPSIQQEYLKLFRDVEINTQLYTNLLNNYQTLKIAKSGEIGNVRVIDIAVKPISAIKPKKKLVILIALIMGSLVGIGLVLLKNLFNSGLKNLREIEAVTGIPVLSSIPRSKIQRGFFKSLERKRLHNLLFLENPEDMSIEALRSLRTALHFSMNSAKNNIIMITGPSPGIGKSFISANFAAVMASSGKTVALIDGDLRRGHLHKYYGQKNVNGLSEVIQKKQIDIDLSNTIVENVKSLPRGKSPSNPAEILMSEEFKLLMEKLSSENDYVIIDSPPTLAVTDSAVIGALAGSTLIVSRYGVSHLEEIKLTVDRLQTSGCNIVGFVFNDVQKEASNSYSYQYGYNYKSK